MENHLIKLIFILISLVVTFSSGIEWHDGDGTKYAEKCDFPGNNFENVTKLPVNECGGECQNRNRCTHFAWTEDKKDGSGTCLLKHDNKISLSDAVETSDERMVCGVLKKTIDRVEMMQAKSSGNQVTFKIKNRCSFKIWPGFIGKSKSNPKWPQPLGGGWELAAGKSTTLRVPKDLFASRIWARTNCKTKNGRFSCETGDCGGSNAKCSGRSGATPATLAEFTLNGAGKKDYYDVSLVDGYNIKISIKPTKPNRDESGKYWCKTTDCTRDLNSICPKELQKKVGKKVVGCLSACEKFNTDLYCCRGQHNKPETCRSSSWPTNYAAVFKRACPTAYSYAYDDSTSTFFCRNTDYDITFC